MTREHNLVSVLGATLIANEGILRDMISQASVGINPDLFSREASETPPKNRVGGWESTKEQEPVQMCDAQCFDSNKKSQCPELFVSVRIPVCINTDFSRTLLISCFFFLLYLCVIQKGL